MLRPVVVRLPNERLRQGHQTQGNEGGHGPSVGMTWRRRNRRGVPGMGETVKDSGWPEPVKPTPVSAHCWRWVAELLGLVEEE